METTSPRSSKQHSKSARVLGAGALALALGAALVGCSSHASNDAKAASTSDPAVEQVAAAPATSSPAIVATVGSPPVVHPSNGGGQSNGGGHPSAPSAPAPVIYTFNTPENIDCHNGNSQMFSASWTTQNAVKTTISIDGPGVYKTYPANGSDSLPFNCSSSHTFKLTAFNANGYTTSRTITLQPRNVQVPPTDPTDTTPTT